MNRACVAVVALALVSTSCGSQIVKAQRRALGKEMPVELEAPTKYEGAATRTAKVRVYADADYRAQNLQWKQGFGDELDYANQLLEPMIGVRLEAEFQSWDRRAPDGTMREALAALVELDPGDDVSWVIGLTSALPLVSASTDELGMAEELGGHIVLRGFNDVEERKAFLRAFPDLDESEREEVHQARRRHKQTVLLVHEIAHTLGAIHETDPQWIMHPMYSSKQASISDRNRELMLIAAEDRVKPKAARDPIATAQKLLAAIEESDWGGWIASEKEQELAQLRADLAAHEQGQTASPVPAAAFGQYQRAQSLAARGQHDDALAELDPVIAAYPGNAAIRLLACQIHLAKSGARDAKALEVCGRAAELAPGDPGPYLSIAAAALGAGDPATARAQLLEAEGRIGNLPTGQDAAWGQLAQMYQAMNALTWAEDAAAKAGPGGAAITAWASGLRARYGVPRDGTRYKITPENEGELLAAVRGALDLVYANKLADAFKLLAKADKRWPNAPGLLAARCDLLIRKQQESVARKLCAKAVAEYDRASWAQYLLGILILRGSDTERGIRALRAAIAADPDLGQAWRALAKPLERAKDQAGLAQLRADYQARFGQPLP